MRLGLIYLILASTPLRAANGDLDARLARFRQVQMPFAADRLTVRERRMVEKLVEACQHLELIFWEQSDPEGLALYRKSTDPKLRRLLMINGSRWDFHRREQAFRRLRSDAARPRALSRRTSPASASKRT